MAKTKNPASDVAQIAWSQISIPTKMAVAAREPLGLEDGVQFKVTARRGQTHKIVLTLNALDLYDIRLVRIGGARSGFKVTEISRQMSESRT